MVSRQIEDVKKQMVYNLDKVLERGEGIEKLVESTSSLNTKYVDLLSRSKAIAKPATEAGNSSTNFWIDSKLLRRMTT